MTINYYLERRSGRKNPELSIQMFIRIRGELLKWGTGEHCSDKDWDLKTQRPKGGTSGAIDLSDCLDTWEDEVRSVSRRARTQKKVVTIEYLKSHLYFITKRGDSFWDIWDLWAEEHGDTWTESTQSRHANVRRLLEEFGKTYKLGFDSLDNGFLKKFKKHCLDKNHLNSYVRKNLDILKVFLNWSVLQDHSINTEYKKWNLTFKKIKRSDNIVCLYADELLSVTRVKLEDQVLRQVRDVFLFACYSGLRHSDMQLLKKTDISDGYMSYTTLKTSHPLTVELNRKALVILEKYEDLPGPFALPTVANQYANNHLKEIGRLAGLDKRVTKIEFRGNKRTDVVSYKWEKLSTHIAKKTFCSMAVAGGTSLEMISNITGNSIKSLDPYINLPESVKTDFVKKIGKLRIAAA